MGSVPFSKTASIFNIKQSLDKSQKQSWNQIEAIPSSNLRNQSAF